MSEDAKIGYPPACVGGIPVDWLVGAPCMAQQAKRTFFRRRIDGAEAVRTGWRWRRCRRPNLDARGSRSARRSIAGVPRTS